MPRRRTEDGEIHALTNVMARKRLKIYLHCHFAFRSLFFHLLADEYIRTRTYKYKIYIKRERDCRHFNCTLVNKGFPTCHSINKSLQVSMSKEHKAT